MARDAARSAAFNRVYERFAVRYEHVLDRALDHKFLVIAAVSGLFLLEPGGLSAAGNRAVSRKPTPGKFTINFRAPAGTRLELTTELAQRIEAVIRKVIPPDELDMVVSNIGLAPSISAIYSPNSAKIPGFCRSSSSPGTRLSTAYYVGKLEAALPSEVPEVRTLFSSGSIIDAVLNFGSLAPIDVQFSGREFDELYRTADQAREADPRLAASLADLHPAGVRLSDARYQGRSDQGGAAGPDPERSGLQRDNGARTPIMYIAPSIWIDRKDNNDYFLTVEYPQSAKGFDSTEALAGYSGARPRRRGRPCAEPDAARTSRRWLPNTIRRRPTTTTSSAWSTCWCRPQAATWAARRPRFERRSATSTCRPMSPSTIAARWRRCSRHFRASASGSGWRWCCSTW